jgi:transcriptional regulator with XRE-family HTH domain
MTKNVLQSSLMQGKSSLEFAGRLSLALIKAGMKASTLASKAGVSKGYVSDLLKGKKGFPSAETCKKFSEVLGVPQIWLFSGDEPTVFAVRDGNPKDRYPPENEENAEWLADGLPPDLAAKLASATAPLRQMQAQIQAATEPLRRAQSDIIAALQRPPFSLLELQERMQAANAWPASATDGKLTPGQLWAKYAPK